MKNGLWMNRGMKGRFVRCAIYLLSPESSMKTGFEKPPFKSLALRSDKKGTIKVLFWTSISVLVSSMIAKLA